ncbi:MAG: tyrosine-type recombinase/integrase [Clostridia bacterium]|nr:tyrosine-type recombinase/integrase [Clostridia bacterium]
MGSQTYFNERNSKNEKTIWKIVSDLPPFCEDFFLGIENNTSVLTRLNYAYDLRLFFTYLFSNTKVFNGKTIENLTPADLDNITSRNIERFISDIGHYNANGKVQHNNEDGKARKIATIRSFLKYYFKRGLISSNVASNVDIPKLHDKTIIRLEADEVAKFLNEAEYGDGLSGNAKAYHEHTKVRDVAILTTLLGTGMRVSECVGLDVSDVDFEVGGLRITRKGGNQVVIYFGDEIREALENWLELRNKNQNLANEPALFTSLQNKRITTRAVQKLVKKYSEITTPLKHITPHKLRSTYGTALYQETQDIYIVADVLGHKDVNTTKKHYAAMSDEIRRQAANKVKLREN